MARRTRRTRRFSAIRENMQLANFSEELRNHRQELTTQLRELLIRIKEEIVYVLIPIINQRRPNRNHSQLLNRIIGMYISTVELLIRELITGNEEIMPYPIDPFEQELMDTIIDNVVIKDLVREYINLSIR